MTFEALARANRIRCESPEGYRHSLGAWRPSQWTNAMAGEQGEACNLAKKIDRILDDTRGNPEGMTLTSLEADLKDEIADVVIYADLLAQALGTSLELIVRRKWNKSSEKIGYPERL